MADITSIQNRFAIPGFLRFEEGPNHLCRSIITTAHADAELYLHGAHLTHYRRHSGRASKPLLFMSGKSWFEPNKPIRGGVPVIFPWFGSRQDALSSPAHGFARLKEWTLESAELTNQGAIALTLRLESDAVSRAAWPHEFVLRYHVKIGASLTLALEVFNPSSKPIRFEEALHTYLAVSDARNITVEGLAGTSYLDKMEGFQRKQQDSQPIRINRETDRIYLNTQSACVVSDPGWERQTAVEKNGSDATVLWNPWIDKARAMNDFGDDEWPNMVCIETCNVADHAIKLPAGQTHRMEAVIRTEEPGGRL